jgi:transglutaminase-like putative cysteine protease
MHKLPNKVTGSLIILLLLTTAMTGCFSTDDSDSDKRDGFSAEQLADAAPYAYNLDNPTIDDEPVIDTSNHRRVSNIVAIWYFEKNAVYKEYGGILNLAIKNNSTSTIFVYKIGIRPEWYDRFGERGYFADAGKFIKPGEEFNVGMVRFDGPKATGEFEYDIIFYLYLQNETGSWNDCGSQEASDKSFIVSDLPGTTNYEQQYNLPQYYDKINKIVDPTDASVYNLSHEIAAKYQGAYNIYQMCALFDYMAENIKYFSDPSSTENYWCTPDQTIKFGGDCEDHSTLLASLVISLGGAVRMYMTDSHAFIGLYVGSDDNIQDVTEAIQGYYRTDINLYFLKDKLGYWLMMDTIGSTYLGGLPLGGVPVREDGSGWSWGFTETENLFVTDVIPS